MTAVKDNELMPQGVNKSGDTQNITSPTPVNNAAFTENPKKPLPEMKTNGQLPTFRKAGLNKGGASRVSD